MKPYGAPRNWNALEDYVRGGKAISPRKHRECVKMTHRWARRKAKRELSLS